ncbi:MAG: hypothetical protein LLG09_01955 [Negativicutes bacterium]|nr:hypothetical protein [Negativicutes bacterium]
MKIKGWHLIVLAIIVLFIDFFTLGNLQVIDNQALNPIASLIAVLSGLLFLVGIIKTLHDLLSKNKAAKKIAGEQEEQGLKYTPEENIKKTKEKKKWQPVNIVLGLLMIGFVVYFNGPPKGLLSIIIYSRFIPAIALILTKKNNIFTLSVLLLFGLTIFLVPTGDAFIFLIAIIYMFLSIVLRLFKIKWHIAIGLVAALIIGFGLLWENTNSVVHENSLTISKNINHENSIELVDGTGKIATTFHVYQEITARGKGLQEGTWYSFRIIQTRQGEGVGISYPLDNWPIFKIKKNGEIFQRGIIFRYLNLKDVALQNKFNKDHWLPLNIGDYTIQLFKIEKPKGIIVAESNFSIVPYDKETIEKLTAYITVKGDPNKYYDSYTRKGPESMTVWVQSPKGEVIGGTVKQYMTNEAGDIDTKSWIGIMEDQFTTNINGEPVALRSLSGNPLPGVYHYEIIVDGNVVFDLKYKALS